MEDRQPIRNVRETRSKAVFLPLVFCSLAWRQRRPLCTNRHRPNGPLSAGELRKIFGSPLGSFILQILTILVASRACGLILRRLGQPRVMGEIIAGVCLGPPLLEPVWTGSSRGADCRGLSV